MANQALREALQSDGGADVYAPPAHLLVIAEEDPAHPNHHEHMLRVAPDDPENVALLASFREHGWPKSKTIAAWKDGKGAGARFVVSDGRRSLTFVRVENARRKAEKDKRGPIRPRVVLDDDPLLTETIANSMRKDDPPMVKARRFVQLRETMGAGKAAAALGLSLADGNALAEILATPNADLHAAVNARYIPIDVAKRAIGGGSTKVREVIAKATGGDGRIDAGKARAAAREASPVVHRSKPHPKVLAKVAARLDGSATSGAAGGFLLGIRYALGIDVSADVPAGVLAAMTDAVTRTKQGAGKA